MAAAAAATSISSVEQITAAATTVIDRSQSLLFSSISMTAMGRAATAGVVAVFFKWFVRITMYFGGACFVLTTCAVVFRLYEEVARRRRQKAALARRMRQQRLRRRQRSKMMSSIRDAPYDQEFAAAAGADRDEEACVICRTEYEAGETCSLLPRCTHMFHKPCIVAWLSHHTTCPICRATVYTV